MTSCDLHGQLLQLISLFIASKKENVNYGHPFVIFFIVSREIENGMQKSTFYFPSTTKSDICISLHENPNFHFPFLVMGKKIKNGCSRSIFHFLPRAAMHPRY